MPKGYWIACYRSISDPNALAEYAKLAGAAIQAGGGRLLARGMPETTFEAGQMQRTVVIEFDSPAAAIATYNSPAYQAAAKIIKPAAERDIRIIEGLA
jgi:uncharacterized protein (DUF1330 family)